MLKITYKQGDQIRRKWVVAREHRLSMFRLIREQYEILEVKLHTTLD